MFKERQKGVFRQDKIKKRRIVIQENLYKSLLDKYLKGIVGCKWKCYKYHHSKIETPAKKKLEQTLERTGRH